MNNKFKSLLDTVGGCTVSILVVGGVIGAIAGIGYGLSTITPPRVVRHNEIVKRLEAIEKAIKKQ